MKKIEKWALLLGMDEKKSKSIEDFWAMCPCHGDHSPSLHVWVSPSGDVMMKCFVCGATGVDVCRHFEKPIDDLRCDDLFAMNVETTIDWERAVNYGALAVIDKVVELNERLDTASEDLIADLVECFADRVACEVDMRIDKEIADTTPPTEKTARACGFEQKEKRPEEGAGGTDEHI